MLLELNYDWVKLQEGNYDYLKIQNHLDGALIISFLTKL